MSVVTAQFVKTACEAVNLVAELLRAQVSIVDRQNTIVASSKPTQVGLPFSPSVSRTLCYQRIPVQIDSQLGWAIVSEPTGEEVFSPRLARVLIELVIQQTTILDRLPNRQTLKDKFIYDLLHGKVGDEANVLDRAKLLGLNLIPPRAVILIDAADYILMANNGDGERERQRRRVQLAIGSIVNFFHLPDDTICAHLGDGKIAVLKASNTKNMGKWAEDSNASEPSISSWANLSALKRASKALLLRLRNDTGTDISVGIGRYHPGIRGLSRSYQDARAALALGRRFNGHNQIYCLDGLGIAAFVGVADEQTKIELATHLLSPLDCEPELLMTLEAFFNQHCCPSTTAKQLLIHRNTLSYRLDKVTSLTGLNPRHFDDAVQIRLALLLRSL